MKVLSPHLSDNLDFRERFIGEVETLKKLKHPNIVQLFGYGHEDEHLFYVMELVEGHSLQDELSSGRRFEWREVARIGVDVCRALKHAHDSGVIHRDLKPANLLIDKMEQVKLTDFGIAKLYGATNLTAAGGILGTADYMAPEQAEAKPITVRCDLYSLGSVLYALLTGRPPFAAKTLAEVIHALRFDKPVPVRRIALNTPAEFEAIILQLLEKDPAKRIPSAFAVSNLLRAMEHALSMETQIGTLKVNELPNLASPAKPFTQGGGSVDATIATGFFPPRTSSATVDISNREEEADYRLSAPMVTAATSLPSNIHSQPTAVGTTTEEVAPLRAKFVTMQEEEAQRKQSEHREEESPPVWLVATGLVLLVLLFSGMYWYAVAPPTANQLYKRIEAAAKSEDVEKLAAVKGDMQQFLEKHAADPRANEVSGHVESLEMLQLQRNFELKARLGGMGSLAPVERAYLDAVRLANSDPEKAIAQFQAVSVVFSEEDPAASVIEQRRRRHCVQIAKQQIVSLQETIQETAATYRALVARELKRATELEKSDAAEAQSLRRGLIQLYGEKSWAQDLLAEVREKVGEK